MDEIFEYLFGGVLKLISYPVRALLYVLSEIFPEYILWPIGWCFWRVVTLGKYPLEGILGEDEAAIKTQLLVGFTGLILPIVCLILIGAL